MIESEIFATGIKTKRFKLTRFNRREHFDDDFISWWKDPSFVEAFNLKETTRKEILRRVEMFTMHNRELLIISPYDKPKIGFFHIICNKRHGETAIGIGDREWWGKGVATELRIMAFDLLFDHFDVPEVRGSPVARNFASIFGYKQLGFELNRVEKTKQGEVLKFRMSKEKWNERN